MTRRLLLVTIAIAICTSVACDRNRRTAEGILARTIPAGHQVPSLAAAPNPGTAAQYTWDFETLVTAPDYNAWLKEQFRDYEVVADDPTHLRLAKVASGDAYRLMVSLDSRGAGLTHVHAQLTFAPD